MKKRYMKPSLHTVSAYTERHLMAGSAAASFNVGTNLYGLGGFGGGGNAGFGD